MPSINCLHIFLSPYRLLWKRTDWINNAFGNGLTTGIGRSALVPYGQHLTSPHRIVCRAITSSLLSHSLHPCGRVLCSNSRYQLFSSPYLITLIYKPNFSTFACFECKQQRAGSLQLLPTFSILNPTWVMLSNLSPPAPWKGGKGLWVDELLLCIVCTLHSPLLLRVPKEPSSPWQRWQSKTRAGHNKVA